MAEYDNRNRFTLFRNTKKREGKKDADFNGTFTDANGKEYWINAWSTAPKNGGEKFLSGSVKPKDQLQNTIPQSPPRINPDDLSDEVPF